MFDSSPYLVTPCSLEILTMSAEDEVVVDPVGGVEAQNRFFRSLVDRLDRPSTSSAKTVPCEVYSVGQDFDLWITLFVDTVKAVNNLKSNEQARINALCLTWLPTKLHAGETRAVYENLPQEVKQNWQTLKTALSKAFRNDEEEIAFINNEAAWKRTPNMPLRDYKNGLLIRMDKYQSALRAVKQEWERCAVRRFRAGLNDDVLSVHILMTCVNDKHTLEDAFNVACTYEQTLKTIAQSGNKAIAPTLAAVLPIPQMSAATEPTQLSAFSSRTDERFEGIETAVKKTELDLSELKSGLTELKETVKEMKNDIVTLNNRSLYPRQTRTYNPFSRMPLQNATSRQYQQYPRQTPSHQQNIVPGLTNGPGYVNQPGLRPQANQTHPPARSVPDPFGSRMGRGLTDVKFPTQGPSAPTLGAVEGGGGWAQNRDTNGSFPNPNLQYGACDMGNGWVTWEDDPAVDEYGNAIDPFAYRDMQPPFY